MWNNVTTQTGVELRRHNNEPNWILFVFRAGAICESPIGNLRSGPQAVLCGFTGNRPEVVVAHEIGHALGLLHEHQRPDREDHVTVTNITDPGNANIVPSLTTIPQPFPVPIPPDAFAGQVGDYDCNSLMHYPTAMTVNGAFTNFAATFTPIPPRPGGGCATVGRVTGLSQGDIEAARAMYGSGLTRTNFPMTATGKHIANRGTARRRAFRKRRKMRAALRAHLDTLNTPRGFYEIPFKIERVESGFPFFFGVEYERRGLFVVWSA